MIPETPPATTLPAITLWEPYATLIAREAKRYETRAWSTTYRGPLAIHVGLHVESLEATDLWTCARPFVGRAFQHGVVLALVDVVECRRTQELRPSALERAFGDWRSNRWAWKLTNVRPLSMPVKIRGRRGLWTIPPAEADLVRRYALQEVIASALCARCQRRLDTHVPGQPCPS